jgi:hypothetical protein
MLAKNKIKTYNARKAERPNYANHRPIGTQYVKDGLIGTQLSPEGNGVDQ